MQADDIYRFLTLRQPPSLPPSDLRDPFIGAYSHQGAASTDGYREVISAALAAGDVVLARSASVDRLQVLGVAGPWLLLNATFYRSLFLDLPGLVRNGDIKHVERRMVEAFDTNDFDLIAARINEITAQRETVADYLAACSLTGIPNGDLDGAAHLVCCFETIERVLARSADPQTVSPRRVAWQVPLQQGVVTLPFDLAPLSEEMQDLDPDDPVRVGPKTPSGQAGPPMSFVGDLIVLKQQLRRYELGEIAHVENVLAKETLVRSFRKLRRDQVSFLTVQDTEKEVTHDAQSTTRDEMSNEIQKTISEQVDLSANFNVSATYMGPAVSVTASVGGSAGYRRSSEERTSTAVAHSQEVVTKASERVRERTLAKREEVETQETEETAAHTFNNETDQHVVGVYRWLEKAFDLHLVNYGRRLIYEFVVPEPSSYWAALVAARGNTRSGPPPPFPQLPNEAAPPPVSRDLTLADLNLLDAANARLERPARWADLVALAGRWGVALESPPPVTAQVHFTLSAPSEASSDTSKTGLAVGSDALYTLESGIVSTGQSQEPMRIPSGYRAVSGRAALQGWRFLRRSGNTYHGYESGEGHLVLNGKDYTFTIAGDRFGPGGILPPASPPGTPGGPGAVEINLQTEILPTGEFIEGDVAVVLTTSLNGLICSIQMKCERTEAHARAWSQRMFLLFTSAFQSRLAKYEDDRNQAKIGNEGWANSLPSKTAREIERRELKRGIVTAVTHNHLDGIGDAVLATSADPDEPAPKVPALNLEAGSGYEKIVRFFELAFDWNNLSYVFAPYFYGRRGQWNELAVADNADAQFKAFLSAGAARVQVPIRRGYEAQATYFFNGLPNLAFEQRIPWLASMRPLAEELAADAREGFELGDGTITVAAASDTVTGVNTLFRDPQDVDREIRIEGKIYVIKAVRSATEVQIRPVYPGTALKQVGYELGGIVVGPTIPLKLPTTLVAIDSKGLTLPEFAPRYAQ